MIEIPGMLMVGARCKADGKTAFICRLIERFSSQTDIIGVKISTVDSVNASHHPGVGSGGKSSRPSLPYRITVQKDRLNHTDTARMLAAGARKVFWLEALDEHLEQGISELAGRLGDQTVTVCESNRARRIIEPDAFVMVVGSRERLWKPSARNVMQDADRIVTSDGRDFDINPQDIQLHHGRWAVRIPATAIILTGHDGAPTGEKAPMIESLYRQLTPWSTEVIVCADDLMKYTFDGITVVRRCLAVGGPLMDIASALRISANEVNFVIGCDSPRIDGRIMQSMLRQAVDCDAVVPATGPTEDGQAYAVFRKSVIPFVESTIQAGGNLIIDVLGRCRVKRAELHPGFYASTPSRELLSNPLPD